MSYQISIRHSAQKQLDKLSKQDFEPVSSVVSSLKREPRPVKVKKLAASGLWRIRIGKFRIVYSVDDSERKVIIIRIARRAENTYKEL
ncbi:MAG: type II toxin-antitoxin system RelE/ParE family toxin [Dehalococcoidales bacterium]|nr:type II toxin-antitoxin system RelE/ParE family toxin [Dehalococcoidales bacterium]